MSATLSALEQRLDQPTAKGLAHAVSAAIRDGVLSAGDRLPPIRTVAAQLALSPTTVSAAWGLLARSGAVSTDGRRGTTVLDQRGPSGGRYRQALRHESDFTVDLSTGVPDPRLLPSLGPVLAQLTSSPTGSYLDDPVLPELAAVLRADWPCAATDLAVVDGAMDAMDLIVRTSLRYGDRVVVEDPGFPPLVDLLESVGVQLVGVHLDAEGLVLAGLEAALAEPVAAIFLQPRAQNPVGVTMTATRAKAIADLLEGSETLVVEDDSAAGLSAADLASIGRWRPGHTAYIRSFSKSHGPDLRLAALSAPPALHRAITARRELGQGWSSRLLQQVLLGLLTSPAAQDEVAAATATYAARRAHVVDALARRGIEVPGSEGINIWVPVHDETAAVVRLASQGIGVAPGAPFRLGAPDGAPEGGGHLRVTVGAAGDDLDGLAQALADAALAGGRPARAR
ncbi:DNA-binding transcriptional MocR family regulator [Phycicoccus badiiscoriae]|uniref:DNA-binding transcriptional MocR family regulator n=1 Tax=Pedococcus badiiscoriae TaxID=642776 RepID=A0A852WJD1_9MICO|nr:aminotransferase class I/II-fold pyridoxal phosphate-dependent enzyme [Pedococcus badiiscoriae]NYG06754.1 DNA-binding transcriptional MocR family regulator [Pedococcus badiiscoriae]